MSEDQPSYVAATISDGDVKSTEITEAALERFVEGRERRFAGQAERERAELWERSKREWLSDMAAQRREQWRTYFKRQARVHAQLAETNRQRAASLGLENGKRGEA